MKKVYIAILGVILVATLAYAGSREQIVATSSTAVSFTDITIRSGVSCIVRNGAYEVFVDWVGSTPTTTIGVPLRAYDTITLTPYEFNDFQAIASSTTSTIYGMCN